MKVLGHRGSPGRFPRYGENTLRSFRQALEEGADGVEFDVRRCADRIVVIHDATLNRTTRGSGAVADRSYSELSEFDAGYGECIPTLDAVLDELGNKGLLNIELKEPTLGPEVADLITKRRLQASVTVSVFEPDWSELSTIAAKGIPVAPLATSNEIRRLGIGGFVEAAQKLGAEGLHVPREAANSELIYAAHDAGLKLRVFTVNLASEVLRLRDLGADAVISDYPGRCCRLIRAAGNY